MRSPRTFDYEFDPSSGEGQKPVPTGRCWGWVKLLGYALAIPGLVTRLASDFEVIALVI